MLAYKTRLKRIKIIPNVYFFESPTGALVIADTPIIVIPRTTKNKPKK